MRYRAIHVFLLLACLLMSIPAPGRADTTGHDAGHHLLNPHSVSRIRSQPNTTSSYLRPVFWCEPGSASSATS